MEFYWWFIIALVFFILEIVTPGFVLLWFGVGAAVSGVLSLIGVHDVWTLTIVFVVVSIVLVALSRTFFKSFFMRKSPGSTLKTNMDALLDKVGLVTERIDLERSTGRVTIDGQDWSAKSADGALIEAEARVAVTGFEGARLIVKKM